MRDIPHFIGGHSVAGDAPFGDVFDPNTGQVQAHVPLNGKKAVREAVKAAGDAFPVWSGFNPQKRARVMFRFKELVETHMEDLARLLSSEHGKVLADAKGDIRRGLDVVEFACGLPHVQKGAYTPHASTGIDVYDMRVPLGVVAGITPFNFPAMIPMWMFAIAIACGNTFVLKPSEKDPSVPVRLAELMMEAGAPEGVLNVVHGGKDTVDALLTHPDIEAISFVGSSDIAHYVYKTGTAHGKRVQAMGGAKNHGIILPDADMDQVVKDIVGAAFGSAGERCMALPVAVPVGDETARRFIEKLLPAVQALKIGPSDDPGAHYGPMVTGAARDRVVHYITMGEQEGARLLLDGRGFSLPHHEQGFFIGPSIFDGVTPSMQSCKDEIFGPVLQIMRAETLEEAIALPSQHAYGNGASIFTRSGAAAQAFIHTVKAGMVGVNIPIPVPVAYHSFGGWKRSAFGDVNQHGPEGMRFYTKIKTVTQRWPESLTEDSAFIIPTAD